MSADTQGVLPKLFDNPLVQSFVGFTESPYYQFLPLSTIATPIMNIAETQSPEWQQYVQQSEETFYQQTSLPESPLAAIQQKFEELNPLAPLTDIFGNVGAFFQNILAWLQNYWWVIVLIIVAAILLYFSPVLMPMLGGVGKIAKIF